MRDEFMITRQGKQYILFAGLLDAAHSRGLHGIDTDLIQLPNDSNGNVAVVKATVEMEDGRTFSGIGDASPENVGRNIAPHVIRMAETRAKARALRDAVNVGATALEELSDGDDAPPVSNFPRSRQNASSRPAPAREAEPEPEPTGPQVADGNGSGSSSASGGKAGARARKTQVDLLKTLAVEWAGEGGVERLEKRVGKPLADLSRGEADEWIDRLTPEDRE